MGCCNEKKVFAALATEPVVFDPTAKMVFADWASAAATKTFPGDNSPFQATLVGNSSWVGSDGGPIGVWYESTLGASGLSVAQSCLAQIDALMAYNDLIFGVHGKSGNVIVCSKPFSGKTDGSGGAFHFGCSFNTDSPGSDWYECMGPAPLVFGLVMAEVCESYMGLQGRGWSCGGSGGEGLSRFLAEIVSGGPNGVLAAFASGSSWDGTDWISRDQGSDQDYPSIGCAILYCWWMTHLGYTVSQMVLAGEPDGTLASNYSVLTGKPASQAFNDFKAAVALAGGPTSDNPWNAPTPPWQNVPAPVPVPPTPPVPIPEPMPSDYLHWLDVMTSYLIVANKKNKSTVAWIKAVHDGQVAEAKKHPNG